MKYSRLKFRNDTGGEVRRCADQRSLMVTKPPSLTELHTRRPQPLLLVSPSISSLSLRLPKGTPCSERAWHFVGAVAEPHGEDYVERVQENNGQIQQYLEMGTNRILQCHKEDFAPSSSYEETMEALSSLITQRKRGDGSKRTEKFDLMFRYIQALGLEQGIHGLKIIHIAGTKGKGSTCTFSEAILRKCGLHTGLFTSPHLMDVRERYRINGSDISREKFLLYFWECWHQLKARVVEDLQMPSLFQFLTLMAFKIFISEKVDVAIIEVGLGGRLDSTNVVKEPVVSGITSLGMDHTEVLGDTIEKIALEKAGIFKPNVPAFTVAQCPKAMPVLHESASKLMIPLEVAPPVCSKMLNGLHLGLAGDHQFTNAGLAVALCRCWLQRTGHLNSSLIDNSEAGLPEAFLGGLSTAHLSGRAEIVHDELDGCSEGSEINSSPGDLIFYLDGAHSPESMEVCARWFSNVAKDGLHSSSENSHPEKTNWQHKSKSEICYNALNKISRKILLFNCMEVRDPHQLFPQLINICASNGVHFSKALFVPSMSTYHKVDSGSSTILSDLAQDVSWQSNLQRSWEKIIHGKRDTSIHSLYSENLTNLSRLGLLSGDPSENCDPENQKFACSAVFPSLPLTIKLLRDRVRENPSLRLQVLVTGSLHLVGDVLKLLKR